MQLILIQICFLWNLEFLSSLSKGGKTKFLLPPAFGLRVTASVGFSSPLNLIFSLLLSLSLSMPSTCLALWENLSRRNPTSTSRGDRSGCWWCFFWSFNETVKFLWGKKSAFRVWLWQISRFPFVDLFVVEAVMACGGWALLSPPVLHRVTFGEVFCLWSGVCCLLGVRLGVSSWVRDVFLLRGDDGGVPSARTQRCLLVVWPGSFCGHACVFSGGFNFICRLWQSQLCLSWRSLIGSPPLVLGRIVVRSSREWFWAVWCHFFCCS